MTTIFRLHAIYDQASLNQVGVTNAGTPLTKSEVTNVQSLEPSVLARSQLGMFPNAIAVIFPTKNPRFQKIGELIEIERQDLTSQDQQKFEIYITDALNEFAQVQGINLAVKPHFCLDLARQTGHSTPTVLTLSGSPSKDVLEKFKSALEFLLREVTQQTALFDHQPAENHGLSLENMGLLSAAASIFLTKNAGKNVKSAFHVHTRPESTSGLTISGPLPRVAATEKTTEALQGIALPDGFSESNNVIFLRIADSDTPDVSKRWVFQCNHQHLYQTLAEARYKGLRLSYHGVRVSEAGGETISLHLTKLVLVEPEGGATFKLE